MLRKIIHIDEEKCNGCGLCAKACHEGAIEMINGKAKLAREHFCDGFGDCLPACPAGAISFEEREAPVYDEAAVERAKKAKAAEHGQAMQAEMARHAAGQGCPGSRFMTLERREGGMDMNKSGIAAGEPVSRLGQWPCQIRLLPVKAPFYDGAKLLIAADCAAYAYASMHERFMKGRITLIGCPKLDNVDYAEKLAEIIANNDVKGVTIVRMEVPCCGGLQRAAETALKKSGKFIPWQVVTLSRDGRILE
ncbi:MAG: 4Fe-4S binding protein [Deltaproteobacteria bacterium]|nr:4Fe-4S binding protein [Deltaproteobacteria bacterium]